MKCTPWYAVVQALKAEGVKYVFGLPGNPRHLIPDLEAHSDIKFVLVRHEASAVAAAYAHARVTGQPAVCFTNPGPGTTNIVSGLLEATSGGHPVIALANAADDATDGQGDFQELDCMALMKPVTKWAFRVTDPKRIPWVMQRAFSLAVNGRPGGIFIQIPSDVGLTKANIPAYKPHPGRHRMRPEESRVQEAAALISKAARPLIVCGSGAVSSGAAEEVAALSQAAGVPVFTTPGGRGIISEGDDLSLGQIGLYFTDVGKAYYESADLVLSVGSRLEAFQTWWWKYFPAKAKFIQLDIDPAAIALNYRPDVALVGDAKLTLADLLAALEPLVKKAGRDGRVKKIIKAKEKYFVEVKKDIEKMERPIRPPQVVGAINKIFGSDTILVSENGGTDLWTYFWPYYKVLDVGDCVPLGEQTSMGMGVVGTIGAKLARPDKKVVCVSGDGAMQMAMMELATAAEQKCGVTWVVMNNQCLGWPQLIQDIDDHPRVGTNFEVSPDFAALAKAQGCMGIRVTEPEKVERALTQALKANKKGMPVLIDVHIARHVYHKHFVEVHKML